MNRNRLVEKKNTTKIDRPKIISPLHRQQLAGTTCVVRKYYSGKNRKIDIFNSIPHEYSRSSLGKYLIFCIVRTSIKCLKKTRRGSENNNKYKK